MKEDPKIAPIFPSINANEFSINPYQPSANKGPSQGQPGGNTGNQGGQPTISKILRDL